MAGMLPGVECARRRRMWQGRGTGAEQTAGGTKRLSFCLYAAGHGGATAHHHSVGAGKSGSKQRSDAMELAHGWSLDSNAREAKERLDQKLRSNRGADTVIKRHHSAGSIKLSRANGSGAGGGSCPAAVATGVQREVYSKKGVMQRLMRWKAAEQAECAVCLEEFAAGDVLAHLPCGHRFHWDCALPWLEGQGAATNSCPVCRASVDAAS